MPRTCAQDFNEENGVSDVQFPKHGMPSVPNKLKSDTAPAVPLTIHLIIWYMKPEITQAQ